MKITALSILLFTNLCLASLYPKVDEDLNAVKQKFSKLRKDFEQKPANPNNIAWVKSKLQFMFDIDQEARKYEPSFIQNYTPEELNYFWSEYQNILTEIDLNNVNDVRDLLKIYEWFKISEFGPATDLHAWIIIQHADTHRDLQKYALTILSKLYPLNETSRKNYAYLFDRVAVAIEAPEERILQRYATQGSCTGPGNWEPFPTEEPDKIDERRSSMGLNTLAEYIAMFKSICR